MSAYGYWCVGGCGKRVVLIGHRRRGMRNLGVWACSVCGRRHRRDELEPSRIVHVRKGIPL